MANTDITPIPPQAIVGTISPSLPEYICKFSSHILEISLICEIFPLASFMEFMLSIFESSRQVLGSMFTEVLEGTLYKIIGSDVADEIAV